MSFKRALTEFHSVRLPRAVTRERGPCRFREYAYGECVSARGTAALRRVARESLGIDDSSRGENTVARGREIRSVLDAVAYARLRREVEAR